MKRGDKFTHARWLDKSNQPLQCVVTAVRNGVVYWRAHDGIKSRQWFPIEDAAKYVKGYAK